jgi:hypothetical protein
MTKCLVCGKYIYLLPRDICESCIKEINSRSKVCIKCKRKFKLKGFYWDWNNIDWHKNVCKSCYKEQYRNRYYKWRETLEWLFWDEIK